MCVLSMRTQTPTFKNVNSFACPGALPASWVAFWPSVIRGGLEDSGAIRGGILRRDPNVVKARRRDSQKISGGALSPGEAPGSRHPGLAGIQSLSEAPGPYHVY
jgi:hypothetical protein